VYTGARFRRTRSVRKKCMVGIESLRWKLRSAALSPRRPEDTVVSWGRYVYVCKLFQC